MDHQCEKMPPDNDAKILNYYDSSKQRVIYYCHYCGEILKEEAPTD